MSNSDNQNSASGGQDASRGQGLAPGSSRRNFGEGQGAGPLVSVPDFSGRSEQAFRPHFASPRVGFLRGGPRVVISPEAYRTMLLYVELAPLEVGWQGTATRIGNDFIIDKVYLLRQTVSAATTDISVQGRDELCMELLSQGQAGVEAVNNLRFWGHSHVRMEVEASGRDEMTMREFEEGGLPWAIRGIFNKLGRGKFSLFLYEDGMRIDDVPWVVAEISASGLQAGAVLSPNSAVGRILLAQGGAGFGGRSAFGQGSYPLPSSGNGRDGFGWNGRGRYLGDMGDADETAEAAIPGSSAAGANWRRNPYEGLAPELIPNDALRAAVSADYKDKVDERGFRSWWTRLHGDLPGEQSGGKIGASASGRPGERTGATAGGADPVGPALGNAGGIASEGDGKAELLQSLGIDRIRGGSEVGDGSRFADGRGVGGVEADDRFPLPQRTDGGGNTRPLYGRRPISQEEPGVVATVLGWLGWGGSKSDSGSGRGGR